MPDVTLQIDDLEPLQLAMFDPKEMFLPV